MALVKLLECALYKTKIGATAVFVFSVLYNCRNTAEISTKSIDSRLGSVATQFAGAADCLDIYIKRLPAGTHTLEYTVTTDRTGRFLLPPATVQCLAIPWNENQKGLLQASTPAETLIQ